MNKYTLMDLQYNNDECYTTRCESDKICSFLYEHNVITDKTIVWLPFDNELSNIYKSVKQYTSKIIISNLEMGLDFYNYEPEHYDMIITNPPFSGRTDLMNRLLSLYKPFVLLQATQFFNNQYAVNLLCDFSNDFQFVLPRGRMSFLRYDQQTDRITNSLGSASFYSFWLCFNMNLPKTFNALKDNGMEKVVEQYVINGDVIKENHLNLFNV